jgi:hypothetical protein
MKYTFSGHEKFDCKFDWLSKYLIYNKPLNVNDETIMHLGLGANMIKSLNYWVKLFEIDSLKEFLQKDIFFESLNTLWLMHYNLVKNGTVYNLFFNQMNFYKFTKEDIFEFLVTYLKEKDIKFSENTIKNDIDVFIKIYADFFKELNIINKHLTFYKLNIKSKSDISDKLFLYFLADFIEFTGAKDSVSLFSLQNSKFSLQKTLIMSENALFDKLYKLETISNGIFIYNESAVLREIYIKKEFNKKEFLEDVFNEI